MKPFERLRELRERAGVTAEAMGRVYAKKRGRKMPARPDNTWLRYENEGRGDKLLPRAVGETAMEMLVGRGQPKVTRNDIISISDMPRLATSAPEPASNGNTNTPPPPARRMVHKSSVQNDMTALAVRFRVASGMYLTTDRLANEDYGPAPITKAPDLPDNQFCAVMGEDSAKFGRHAVLHCVDARSLDVAEAIGKYVLVFVEEERFEGLGHVGIAKLVDAVGNNLVLENSDGVQVHGTLLGVVRGAYERV